MVKKTAIIFLFFLSVYSCSDNHVDVASLKANGGARYGGEFRFMSTEKITSLFPLATSDVYNQRLSSQIFETILKIDFRKNKVVPHLAESYHISPDAKKFTIKMKEGIYFQDDDCFSGGSGREVNAEDVKFMLDFACSGLKINEMSWMLVDKIKGAKEFNKKSKITLPDGGVKGIQVVDDKTITIELVEPFVSFEKILTHSSLSLFPKEAWETYKHGIKKHPVGTGPFQLSEFASDKVVLNRNSNYWRKDDFGNQLPFLEKVILTYVNDKKSELFAFRKKEIDLVLEIPVDEIDNVLGTLQEAQAGKTVKHKIDSKNSLSSTYFGFAHDVAPFNDLKVRQAFNLAIDRKAIIDKNLKGEGYPALNGFVPQIEGYTTERVKGFRTNISKAKQLMAQAGYPEGKNFPAIELYVNSKEGSSVYMMAKGVLDQLNANLNLNLQLKLCSLEERDKAINEKKALFWRGGWIADYPDPENFLSLFSSEHVGGNSMTMNQMKYISQEYDRLLNMAMKERNSKIRNEFFIKCDQLLIDDAVIMPLLNDDFITMINSKIKNFETNSMEGLDFSSIFIKEPKNITE
ncbi:MAG: ABC transporter substrate-binding protein [Flavobacteriia bacterium]|nr:ABC transporter substrate-binding protein [Flavobacteriia bacterium]